MIGVYKWYYEVENEGFKYHGNSIMAAMGLVALKYLDQDNAYRRQVASWYDELLNDKIQRVSIAPGCETSRHLYQILLEDRDQVMLALNEQGIYPGVHYRDNTLYKMYTYASGTCPRSLDASSRLMSLPLHVGLTRNDVRRVSQAVGQATQFLARNR